MDRPRFTLIVAVSADGFLAREPGHLPQEWTSAEEAAQFRADLDLGDWQIMGRTTHQLAPSETRRRIVFSTSRSGWNGSHLWLDPANAAPAELAEMVAHVHPMTHGLILGGTGVHDWFLNHNAIDAVHLTVEPVTFGEGLPIFSDQGETRNPVDIFTSRGFVTREERDLNVQGTKWIRLARGENSGPSPT